MSDPYGGLEAAARQFEASKGEARAIAGNLSEAQLNWRPASNRWSIAECLLHLATSDAVLAALDTAINTARAKGWVSPGPFRYGWFTRINVRIMEPPPKFRMKTFSILTPPGAPHTRDTVLRTFDESRDRLLQRVRQAAGLDLKRAIVISPVSRFFRLPLGGYVAFLAAHDRRHLWQAKQVQAAPGWPRT